MFNRGTKYIYYFRPNLTSHVHFYQAWVGTVVRKGIPMVLLTFMDPVKYIQQYYLIKKYRKEKVKIYLDDPFKIFSRMYFFLLCLINKKVIIQLKKQNTRQFDRLKKIFPKKCFYIYEGEGDALSEIDYLEKHSYKEGFYDKSIESLRLSALRQKKILRNADQCTFGYQPMKDMLISRYPDLNLKKKITLLPMSFARGSLEYSCNRRDRKRSELLLLDRFVIIYIGNAFYSWQNIYRTLQIFDMIKKSLKPTAYLILLIRKQDFSIIQEFLKDFSFTNEDYMLSNVSYEEIPDYLNASDLGVCLRHKHIMNKTTPSGKILDYLGCGLPVLTTNSMGVVSEYVKENDFGIVLEDMDNDNEVLSGLRNWLSHNADKRREISKWANENISLDAYITEYIKVLFEI
jgi:glycosyltransferase involved in cell wall biosynthesis